MGSYNDGDFIFRPKFGRARAQTFRNDILAQMARIRSGRPNGSRARPGARCGVGVPMASKNARRVIVKAHIVKMTAYGTGAARQHLAYVQREGVEKDGSKGLAYGADGPSDAKAFAQPLPNEKHQFRLIVSPEDAGELEMTHFVRRYMASVERDLHQPLQWMAVNHYNTDHPHVHIIIRGVDKDGEQLRMDRGYISQGLRERAQDLVTRELGPRYDWEIQRQRLHEVDKNRVTGLDAEVKRLTENDVIEVRGPRLRVEERLLLGRLKHLETLGLAKQQSSSSWRLTQDWQQQLRDLGKRGDIIARMHQAIGGDPTRYEIMQPGALPQTPSAQRKPIVARVVRKDICDDRPNSYSLMLETLDGRALYTSLRARDSEVIRHGDLVVVGWTQESTTADGRPKPAELRVVRQALTLQEQIGYAGPVWLDRVSRSELADTGLGTKVADALNQREQFLQRHGIRPDDPGRVSALLELERRTVGEQRSRKAGETFLENVPTAFRGRVSITEATSSGMQYAVISDASRFVLVPVTNELKEQIGKQVVVSQTEGRLVVRSLGKDRGDKER